MHYKNNIYQIIDININRITGALRLLEDFSRTNSAFSEYTPFLKNIRHDINKKFNHYLCINARNTYKDTGKFLNPEYEIKQKDLFSIIISNIRRIAESLRVLEELSKTHESTVNSVKILKRIRFDFYDFEKDFLYKLNYKGEEYDIQNS